MSETFGSNENKLTNEYNKPQTIKLFNKNQNEYGNNLSQEDVNKLVNTFYKMNYLIKNKNVEYLNVEYKNEIIEEKVAMDTNEDNLLEILKEIDKQPIPYNETFFIDRDPFVYNSEKKGIKKKVKKTALLQDLTVKPREKSYNKEEDFSVFDQLKDLDEEYKKMNKK